MSDGDVDDDEVDRLVKAADADGSGAEVAERLERAARSAESRGDLDAAFRLRVAAFGPANHDAMFDRMMVNLAWCLAQSDRDPERFAADELLGPYMMTLGNGMVLPSLPAGRLWGLLADCEARLRKGGVSGRIAADLRMSLLLALGRIDEAVEQVGVLQRHRHDAWSFASRDWEAYRVADLYARAGRDDDALRTARPLLGRRLDGDCEPVEVYAAMQLSALRVGDLPLAERLHRQGFRRALNGGGLRIIAVGEHLRTLALTHNVGPALDAIRRHARRALATVHVTGRRTFATGAELTFARLAAAGRRSARVDLPADFPGRRDDGTYAPDELKAGFAAVVDALDAAYDDRNGNDFFSRETAAVRAMLDAVGPHPFAATTARRRRSDE